MLCDIAIEGLRDCGRDVLTCGLPMADSLTGSECVGGEVDDSSPHPSVVESLSISGCRRTSR